MQRLACLLFAACLALPALAEEAGPGEERFGAYTVHYSAFTSTYLQPQVAQQLGLLRGKQLGVLNVTVLKDGQPQPALVSGTLRSLTGTAQPLDFRTLREKGAVYTVAQYPVPQQETRIFELKVQAGGVSHRFSFRQELFPDP
ncbi:DUF4426 domain-containing protein [Pseudomonas sp. DTU_2021_1001937_2_SI_NGA_ILE_001]|uniref:DUF4426 domain-containing protein n=1 Tax=Pseudomonas sp. DTU_2021_1001937_2_SI_NGA_ILE_001 TaxID=3077589 RepID=UPI0028FC0D9B|nr:DUF4426 domain-containing protein [Pseudomonas sp. DTU_2021_1001937_2_SI_NGA_ILE_001]WNW12331.1 DUF4426 domain-containing protein [Pseudomonas sp. DTU_2021_1001937_2_SI_NGA_ILE_001]